MNRETYRAQIRTEQPRHFEARRLGITSFSAIKSLKTDTALAIRAAWDYRAAGFTVDEARRKLHEWRRESYHPHPVAPATGRYNRAQNLIKCIRTAQANLVKSIASIELAGTETKPTWDNYQVRLEVAGRTLITQYHEDVDWGERRERRNPRYPAHTTRTYTTYLLRGDYATPMSAKTIIDQHLSPDLRLAVLVEKSVTHDLRGHWWARVITALLGIEYSAQYKMIEREETVYKIVERNGKLRSVYAPEFIYPLDEWIRDPARPDHRGGIYAYADQKTAIIQARANETFLAEWQVGKELVLCECSAKGRRITYGDKHAYSNLKINKVLTVIQQS